ncbi:MAG: winged helix-turn-helix domain-containing protein [Muribaculaceae bacterium]
MIMCKYFGYIKTAIEWLNGFLSQEVSITSAPAATLQCLPIALVASYDFFIGAMLGVDTLFVAVKDMQDLTPQKLAKQVAKIAQFTNLPVVCIFERLESFQLTRLAKQGVNFIDAGKHAFLPSFLIALTNGRAGGSPTADEMPPFAQFIVLYHLQVESLTGETSSELSKRFQASYSTCSRALQWLKAKGLVIADGAKAKPIAFKYCGKELWENALQYMVAPIQRYITVASIPAGVEYAYSGERALSQYTMLDCNKRVVAISKGKYNEIKDSLIIDPYGEVTIEIWNYDPCKLGMSGYVDRLSLYLSLKDNQDERVSKELETMIQEIQW